MFMFCFCFLKVIQSFYITPSIVTPFYGKYISWVIKEMGESQNGCYKKTKYANFSKK